MFSKFGSDMTKVDVEGDPRPSPWDPSVGEVGKASAAASSLIAKQREVLQETLNQIGDMAQSFRAPGNPQELMAKQGEFVRRSFEAAVKNASETAEIVKKSGRESIDILRERIRESMQEIRSGFEDRK